MEHKSGSKKKPRRNKADDTTVSSSVDLFCVNGLTNIQTFTRSVREQRRANGVQVK